MSDYFGGDSLSKATTILLWIAALGILSLIAWIVYGLVCWIF